MDNLRKTLGLPHGKHDSAEHGHMQWEAFKTPEMKCWGIHDDLGFTMLTHDRDGYCAKRIAETLNLGEATREGRLGTSDSEAVK